MTIHVPLRPLGRALMIARAEPARPVPLYLGLRPQPLPPRQRQLMTAVLMLALGFLLGALSGCNQSTIVYGCPTATPAPMETPHG